MREGRLKRFVFWLFELSKVAVILIIAILILYYFLITVFVVQGASMEPSFKNKEAVLVERVSYLIRNPRRGEVAILKFPGRPTEKYIKRIIGLPNETVEIKEGDVYINEQKLKEEYLTFETSTTPPLRKTLGKNEYFVLGDNRQNSNDSRIWGACPKNHLIGKAVFVLWPLSQWNLVASPNY